MKYLITLGLLLGAMPALASAEKPACEEKANMVAAAMFAVNNNENTDFDVFKMGLDVEIYEMHHQDEGGYEIWNTYMTDQNKTRIGGPYQFTILLDKCTVIKYEIINAS